MILGQVGALAPRTRVNGLYTDCKVGCEMKHEMSCVQR